MQRANQAKLGQLLNKKKAAPLSLPVPPGVMRRYTKQSVRSTPWMSGPYITPRLRNTGSSSLRVGRNFFFFFKKKIKII
jgi:hypothetical protein